MNNVLAGKEKAIKDLKDKNLQLQDKLNTEGPFLPKVSSCEYEENNIFVIEERKENDKVNYDTNNDFNNLYED